MILYIYAVNESCLKSFHSEAWLFEKNVILDGEDIEDSIRSTHLDQCLEQCHANEDCVGFYWGVEDSNRDTYKDCHLKRTLTYKPKSNRYISAKKYDQLSLAEKTKIDDGNLVICTGLTIGTPIKGCCSN